MKVNIIKANGVKERTVHFFDSVAMQEIADSLRNSASPTIISGSGNNLEWSELTTHTTSIPEKTFTDNSFFTTS